MLTSPMLAERYMQHQMKRSDLAYMTSTEVADLLGVSLRTVVNLRRRRVLPHIKIGRLVRFSREQVELALRSYTVNELQVRPGE
jgi:excisionase family DNA binding protein